MPHDCSNKSYTKLWCNCSGNKSYTKLWYNTVVVTRVTLSYDITAVVTIVILSYELWYNCSSNLSIAFVLYRFSPV